MARIQRNELPQPLLRHLLARAAARQLTADDLTLLGQWLETDPEVPDGDWFKIFPNFFVCGQGELIKTFLPKGRLPTGTEVTETSAQANQLVRALLEDVYSYSSTQIDLPEHLADFVLKWGKLNIPDQKLYHDEKGGLGRETEGHVTVKYGLLDKHPSEKLLKIIETTTPFTIRLGKVSFFESEEYDVVKLEVESEELRKLNAAISAQCEHEDKHPKYTPHATVAYCKKGTVADLAGAYPFEESADIQPEFEAQELIFSPAGDGEDKERTRLILPFNRLQQEAETAKQFLKRRAEPRAVLLYYGDTRSAAEAQRITKSEAEHLISTKTSWPTSRHMFGVTTFGRYPFASRLFIENEKRPAIHTHLSREEIATELNAFRTQLRQVAEAETAKQFLKRRKSRWKLELAGRVGSSMPRPLETGRPGWVRLPGDYWRFKSDDGDRVVMKYHGNGEWSTSFYLPGRGNSREIGERVVEHNWDRAAKEVCDRADRFYAQLRKRAGPAFRPESG